MKAFRDLGRKRRLQHVVVQALRQGPGQACGALCQPAPRAGSSSYKGRHHPGIPERNHPVTDGRFRRNPQRQGADGFAATSAGRAERKDRAGLIGEVICAMSSGIPAGGRRCQRRGPGRWVQGGMERHS
jgi:hypothetical protein